MVALNVQIRRLEQQYAQRYQVAYQRRIREAEQQFGAPLSDEQWNRIHRLSIIEALIRPHEFFQIMGGRQPDIEEFVEAVRERENILGQVEVREDSPQVETPQRRGCRCTIM